LQNGCTSPQHRASEAGASATPPWTGRGAFARKEVCWKYLGPKKPFLSFVNLQTHSMSFFANYLYRGSRPPRGNSRLRLSKTQSVFVPWTGAVGTTARERMRPFHRCTLLPQLRSRPLLCGGLHRSSAH